MTTTQTAAHIEIWFGTDSKGRRIAHRWNTRQLRAFRVGLAEAELLIATGQATELPGHPLHRLWADA